MKTTSKLCCAIAAFLSSLLTAQSQSVPSIQYDGILTGADGYSGWEVVTFFNGHDSSTYGDFDTQYFNTIIRYGVGTVAGDASGTQYFFLFAESPLEAKNMVWGSGMTAQDISDYGKMLDFSGATGSEKISILDGKGSALLTVDVGSQVNGNTGKTMPGFGLISFKDSVDYLIGNGISTTTTSSARNQTMSVEMQFALNPTQNAAVVAAALNGLDIHLSPDRGLIPALVPEPSSALLFSLISAISLLRRKR